MELRSKVRDLIGSSRLKPHMTMLRANLTSFLLSLRPRQRELSWKLHWRMHVSLVPVKLGERDCINSLALASAESGSKL